MLLSCIASDLMSRNSHPLFTVRLFHQLAVALRKVLTQACERFVAKKTQFSLEIERAWGGTVDL